MKLLITCDINTVKTCQSLFSVDLPSVIVEKLPKCLKAVSDIMCVCRNAEINSS